MGLNKEPEVEVTEIWSHRKCLVQQQKGVNVIIPSEKDTDCKPIKRREEGYNMCKELIEKGKEVRGVGGNP